MPARIDITNQRFGRLVALRPERNSREGWHWLCICDCGKQTIARGVKLRGGDTRSCGCSMYETKHGHSGRRHNGRRDRSPTYHSWVGMLTRCRNNKQRCYTNYGSRGITVCERWHSFENFLADMGERPTGLSLDRINNDGNYEPGNCQWATAKEQRANQQRYGQKLFSREVIAIRNDTRSQHTIAAEYAISIAMVSSIKSRKRWQNIA